LRLRAEGLQTLREQATRIYDAMSELVRTPIESNLIPNPIGSISDGSQ